MLENIFDKPQNLFTLENVVPFLESIDFEIKEHVVEEETEQILVIRAERGASKLIYNKFTEYTFVLDGDTVSLDDIFSMTATTGVIRSGSYMIARERARQLQKEVQPSGTDFDPMDVETKLQDLQDSIDFHLEKINSTRNLSKEHYKRIFVELAAECAKNIDTLNREIQIEALVGS